MVSSTFLEFLAISSIVCTSIASPIANHHLHKQKRAISTVHSYVNDYVTAYVQVTVEATQDDSDPTNTASSSSASFISSSSNIVYAIPTTTSSTYIAPSSTSSIKSSLSVSSASKSTTSSPSFSSSSSPGKSGAPTSGSHGITYSPYSSTGSCKDLDTIKSDFKQLTSYDVIRIYDTDCDQVQNVLQAKSNSQKLLLGIFYVSKISDSVSIIKDAVSQYGSWDDIYAISIGNELVNNGEATASSIAGYIDTARSALTAAGYSGKVITVDTFNAVIANPSLCTVGDFVAVNAHSFFSSSTSASDAGKWLKDTIKQVADACGINSKKVIVTESGWPSQGSSNGDAVPSSENQATAMSAIITEVGDQVFSFTAFNDPWKQPGAYGVEQYFGILD